MVEKLRIQAEEIGAEYVIFISDCWSSKQLESQPSLDPKRNEAIVMTCQFGDISFFTMQEYTRTDDNQIILGERIIDHADGGIFASILPKSSIKHAESNA